MLDAPMLVHQNAWRRQLFQRLDVNLGGGTPQPRTALAPTFTPGHEWHGGQLRQSHSRSWGAWSCAKQPVLLVDGLEQFGIGGLGHADKQIAVIAQTVAKNVLQLLLQFAIEVYQQIAT